MTERQDNEFLERTQALQTQLDAHVHTVEQAEPSALKTARLRYLSSLDFDLKLATSGELLDLIEEDLALLELFSLRLGIRFENGT